MCVDIKSHNIFFQGETGNEQPTYFIGDFDSAKIITKNDKPMSVIGTPSFMAPEILACNNETQYSFAADSTLCEFMISLELLLMYYYYFTVFSFGMVIYELLALDLPYSELRAFDIAETILRGEAPPLPPLSSEFDCLVDLHKDCIKKNPKERPSSRHLFSRLESILCTTPRERE